MENVQGSIEVGSDSDEEIKPANLSDEFEQIAMVVPPDDEEAGAEAAIMDNVANLVDMLEEPSKKEENLVAKFENEQNTKKSFELKVENDDDDEIFIVHEEDDNDNQGDLFAEGAFQSFDDDSSPTKNPFAESLANSEALPVIQKLDVKINDDYLAQYQATDDKNEESKNSHTENIQRRKNLRGKK